MPRSKPYTIPELARLRGCAVKTVKTAIERNELEILVIEDDEHYLVDVIPARSGNGWKPRGRGAPKGSGKLPDALKRNHLIKTYANDAELKKFHAKIKEGERAQEAARRLCCE